MFSPSVFFRTQIRILTASQMYILGHKVKPHKRLENWTALYVTDTHAGVFECHMCCENNWKFMIAL